MSAAAVPPAAAMFPAAVSAADVSCAAAVSPATAMILVQKLGGFLLIKIGFFCYRLNDFELFQRQD